MKVKAKKTPKKSPSAKSSVKVAAPKKSKVAATVAKPAAPVKTGKVVVEKVKTILITQPKPESDKNPYTDLAKKHKLEISFQQFIHLEGIDKKDFRNYKINIIDFQAIVFTSRNAIDHFFKLCDELRVRMPQDTKYYCMTEAIALYLQKYILYRKRKVFYGNGSVQSLTDSIMKHRDGERYLIPCADNHKSDIGDYLKKQGFEYKEAVIFRTVALKFGQKDIRNYDMLVFFAPAGVNALLENIPGYKQGKTRIGGFGPLTEKAVLDAGLRLDVKAPTPVAPSMAMAIDQYLSGK